MGSLGGTASLRPAGASPLLEDVRWPNLPGGREESVGESLRRDPLAGFDSGHGRLRRPGESGQLRLGESRNLPSILDRRANVDDMNIPAPRRGSRGAAVGYVATAVASAATLASLQADRDEAHGRKGP